MIIKNLMGLSLYIYLTHETKVAQYLYSQKNEYKLTVYKICLNFIAFVRMFCIRSNFKCRINFGQSFHV